MQSNKEPRNMTAGEWRETDWKDSIPRKSQNASFCNPIPIQQTARRRKTTAGFSEHCIKKPATTSINHLKNLPGEEEQKEEILKNVVTSGVLLG